MTGLVLPDAATDPAGFVLAVADLREKRANAVRPERWTAFQTPMPGEWMVAGTRRDGTADPHRIATTHGLGSAQVEAEHIAAEANPAHALAEVALWRGLARRHEPLPPRGPDDDQPMCAGCVDPGACGDGEMAWPCPDLLAVVAAARAYLGEQT